MIINIFLYIVIGIITERLMSDYLTKCGDSFIEEKRLENKKMSLSNKLCGLLISILLWPLMLTLATIIYITKGK